MALISVRCLCPGWARRGPIFKMWCWKPARWFAKSGVGGKRSMAESQRPRTLARLVWATGRSAGIAVGDMLWRSLLGIWHAIRQIGIAIGHLCAAIFWWAVAGARRMDTAGRTTLGAIGVTFMAGGIGWATYWFFATGRPWWQLLPAIVMFVIGTALALLVICTRRTTPMAAPGPIIHAAPGSNITVYADGRVVEGATGPQIEVHTSGDPVTQPPGTAARTGAVFGPYFGGAPFGVMPFGGGPMGVSPQPPKDEESQ